MLFTALPWRKTEWETPLRFSSHENNVVQKPAKFCRELQQNCV